MILPFDEVDALIATVRSRQKEELKRKEVIDEVTDLLVLDYVYGTNAAGEMLGLYTEPDMGEMQAAINKKIADKDYQQRLTEYVSQGDIEGIVRVIDTDSTRVFNQAILDAGRRSGAKTKTWQTMDDERVRDTHQFLQGVTVPIDAKFYTYDGDSAYAPGDFSLAENCCNCRCYLTLR